MTLRSSTAVVLAFSQVLLFGQQPPALPPGFVRAPEPSQQRQAPAPAQTPAAQPPAQAPAQPGAAAAKPQARRLCCADDYSFARGRIEPAERLINGGHRHSCPAVEDQLHPRPAGERRRDDQHLR